MLVILNALATSALAASVAVGVPVTDGVPTGAAGLSVSKALEAAIEARLVDLDACRGPAAAGKRASGGLVLKVTRSGASTSVEVLTADAGELAPAVDCFAGVLSRADWPDGFRSIEVPLGFDVDPPTAPVGASFADLVGTAGTATEPPPKQAHIDIGDVSAEGKLSSAQVKGPFVSEKYRLKPCYRDRLAENPELGGDISLALTITQGHATAVTASSTVGDAATEACITKVVEAFAFPAERKATQATVLLTLRSE